MLKLGQFRAVATAILLTMVTVGCSSGGSAKNPQVGSDPQQSASDEPAFDPPTLEELDATAEWIDQPVIDGYEQLKKRVAANPPLIDAETAIGMPNDSDEANEKLVSFFSQLPASDEEVDYDAELTIHTAGDAKSTNPLLISSTTEQEISSLLGFGLFGFDEKFQPYADADTVVSWQVSKDRMADKVIMRDDLTWSDGTPVTAHDIAFSFRAIMNPAVPAVAVRTGTDELADVVAYDDHTVVFFHKAPLATNVWNVNFTVVPKHICESIVETDPKFQGDAAQKFDEEPVVAGAYQIVSRVRQQEIVLERREGWYMHDGKQVRQKPHFKTIRYKIIEDGNTALLALKNGEVDLIDASFTPAQWQSQTTGEDFYAKNTKLRATEWTFYYFGWNVTVPLFSDVRVREAMAYAFDHTEMLDKICYGLFSPALGNYHADSWMAPEPMPKPFTQDLDKAEQLLAEAGWEDTDGDGILDKTIGGRSVPFEFTIQYRSGSDLGKPICTLLKENLDQIGIVCEIKPVEFAQLQQNSRDHKFQAIFAGWGTGADPDTGRNLWTTKAIEDNGRNYVKYSNPKIDELFEAGQKEFDRDKRAKIYGEIATILYNDQPYTWLINRPTLLGINNNLRGITFSPRGWNGTGGQFFGVWKPKKSPQ